ncbi:hypothetical protein Misp01_18090 [Microtetraspora sp. NBRC 13810]|uniref:tetratricopeptide repeat protein n=1 Tax=Microtetraspora sp. NBRC 13810 TaxID=3030990 RepID=UPI0024A564FC|nr:tetratricopeptide repeat protein [Microtetraspora sp. NBRC 13810]GLW06679.1 hypothetical protein Misp01_18090 [Microtetraspora sp. NBRC 13810]
MSDAREVRELVGRAGDMPYGQAKTVLLEEALRRAEALRERDLTFQVRMSLTEAYVYGAEPVKSFATFSRCLAEYDAEPGRFADWQHHSLLWQFKWAITGMTRFPEVPLGRAHDALTEMERRYREAGHGLHAVHAHRCYLAQHVGDREGAEEWFHHWQTTPRDVMSDCEGCDPNGKVAHLVWMGLDEAAVELAAPVVAGELTCHVQPQGILSALLMPYVRTGRLTEAAAAHRRAYRLVQGDANYVDDFGDHMEFCALTGNEARGLEILEREGPLLAKAASPRAAMRFTGAAALLLRRLEETGHGGAAVRWNGGEIPAAELRAEMERDARAFAARFDARNGTAEQGDRVERLLAAQPLVEHLPLTPHARRAVAAPAPVPPRESDPDELLRRAEESWRHADFEAAFAAWARFDEVTGPGEPSGARAARRADGHGLAAVLADRPHDGLREWARAAECYRLAGDELGRQSALGRIGLLKCRMGEMDEGLALVEASAAHLLAYGSAVHHSTATVRLAQARTLQGRTDEAVDLLERAALDDAADGGLLLLLADMLADRPGRAGDALAAAARARAALRGHRGADLAGACLLHARLIRRSGGDLEEALAAYGEALAAAPRSEAGSRAIAHASRGEVLVGIGRAAEAADDLIEAVAAFTALGAAGYAALARVDLCRAYLATGRPLDAAETAEEALALLPADAVEGRTDVRWVRAVALRELGELETALTAFTDLESDLATGRAGTSAQEAARAAEEAGDTLMRLERPLEAARRFAAAAQGHGPGLDAVRALRRQGAALFQGDEEEAALDILRTAGEALARLPRETLDDAEATWESGWIAFEEARTLGWLERFAEAVKRCDESQAAFRSIAHEDAAAEAADLGDQLRRRQHWTDLRGDGHEAETGG